MKEITHLKKVTIPLIQNDFSIFKNVLFQLETHNFKLSTGEFKIELETGSREPRELLALKHFERFKQTKHSADLIKTVELYLTARLFPEGIDYLTGLEKDISFNLITELKNSNKYKALNAFLKYAFKLHAIDLNNPQNILLLFAKQNILKFNKIFVDQSDDPLVIDTKVTIEEETLDNFIEHDLNKLFFALLNLSTEPDIYNVCCHILRYFRVNNEENSIEEIENFLRLFMDNTVRNNV